MSQLTNIWEQFEALERTVNTLAISAIRCGKEKQHLLVKGQYGEPILLLSSKPRRNLRAPISLKHVNVSFDLQYEATTQEANTISIGSYTKFSCDPESSNLHRYFIELLVAIAGCHLGKLEQNVVDEIVDSLLELFRRLNTTTKQTVSGLWGELLLIYAALNPALFIDAWHISNNNIFDFSFPDVRLEVKSTERSVREHEFSLSQVRGERSGDTLVSLRLTSSAAGVTVLDLARKIAVKVSESHQAKLWKLVFEALGDGIESANEQSFDVKTAIDEMMFIPTAVIPAPTISPDDALLVSDVRFRANLSGVGIHNQLTKKIFLERVN